MKQGFLRAEYVEFIPENLLEGVIYVSQKYHTATHRCACGCGTEVVTPLDPTGWSVTVKGGNVTLYPSIGNWSLPCRSHYWIRHGRVVWAGSMTEQEIRQGRDADKRMRDRYFSEADKTRRDNLQRPVVNESPSRKESNWIDLVREAIRTWLR